MTEEKLFECPRCGNFAEFISDYNSARVECKKCGPTKILLSFNSNGDMQTVSENDGKEYEIDADVRRSIFTLEKTNKEDFKKYIECKNNLSLSYSSSGREVKAEIIAYETLEEIKEKFQKDSK